MADHDDWTADDDAQLRAVLSSLRADVEGAPLPDVRFVKARGMARRRQRLFSWTAAAAAAVVVAGTVGYSQFGRDASLETPPATRSGTTSAAPSPTVKDSLDIPGLLPVGSEWEGSLELPVGSATVTPVTKGGGVECGPALGAPKAQQSVTVVGVGSLTLGAAYWAAPDVKKATGQTEAAVEKCENGPGFTVRQERVSNARIYSYTAPGAGVGWFAVVAGGQGVALLQISENSTQKSRLTADQVNSIATKAQARLDRYAVTTSVLPTAAEWVQHAGLAAGTSLVPGAQPATIICGVPLPGTPKDGYSIGTDPAVRMGMAQWVRTAAGQGQATAKKLVEGLLGCDPPYATMRQESSGTGWPRVLSYYTGHTGSGLIAVAATSDAVAVLSLIEPTVVDKPPSAPGFGELAALTQERLGSAPTTPSGVKAIDEVMQVSGPAPVPASKYFVAASQWSDPLLGPGGKTYAGQGNPDDSLGDIGVFCETKDFLSGFGGRLGEVEIQSGTGDGNVIGHQRVRIDDADTSTPEGAALAKTSVKAQLTQEKALLAKGCAEPDGKVTATKGPTDGTFLLTKKVTGKATGTDYRWVGVAPLTTPGAWTTVVFHGTGDGQGFQGTKEQGFAELERLLALARQK